MSYDVDKKIVELEFRGKEFEADVSQALKLLQRLNESMQFEGAADGFREIEKASKRLDFSHMSDALDNIASKFTLLGNIQQRVFQEISNRIVGVERKLESMVKSVSIDQISAGWEKYAEKTQAVQTIMGAVANEVEDVGQRMEYVNSQLKILNWFTDETSYSYLDMVNNIGKFTANLVPLDQSVEAMQGIAVWAAKSGANVQEASRAMYNLSQAISTGSLKLMDWKSIENANMATAEFKQVAIDAAESIGILTKVEDGLWKTTDGTVVSVKQFRDSLQKGWLSNDVLMRTLNTYGGFTTKLHDLYEESGLLTSTLLEAIDAYKAGDTELLEYTKDTTMAADDFRKAIATLSDSNYDFGRSAFQAAQEAKTFREAVDSVKDAVSTSWMTTFETIFGDYGEAKTLWTKFAEWAWEVFNGGAERRNNILEAWKGFGGRTALFGDENTVGIFQELLGLFNAIIEPAKNAWEAIVGPKEEVTEVGRRLAEITYKVRNFFHNIQLSDEAKEGLTKVLTPLAFVINKIGDALGFVGKLVVVFVYELSRGLNMVLEFVNGIDNLGGSLTTFARNSKAAQIAMMALGTFAALPAIAILSLVSGVKKLISICKKSPLIQALANALSAVAGALGAGAIALFDKAKNSLYNLYLMIQPFLPTAESFAGAMSKIGKVFKGIPDVLAKALNSFAMFMRSENKLDVIRDKISSLAVVFQNAGHNIIQGLALGVNEGLTFVVNLAVKLFDVFKNAFQSAAGIHSPSLVMMAFGGMLVSGLILGVAGFVSKLHDAGYDLFEAFAAGLSESKDQNPIADIFTESFVGEDFRSSMAKLFNTFSAGYAKLKPALSAIGSKLKDFFDSLTVGHVIFIAFTTAAIVGGHKIIAQMNGVSTGLAHMAENTATGLKDLFSSVTGIFTALKTGITGIADSLKFGITKFFDTIAARERANNLLKTAAALAVFTAAFLALYYVFKSADVTAIVYTSLTMATALGILAGAVFAISKMSQAIEKAGGFDALAKALLMLSGVMTVFSFALASMTGVVAMNPAAASSAFFFMFLSMIELLGLAWSFNKLMPEGIKAMGGMLQFAASTVILAKAFSIVGSAVAKMGGTMSNAKIVVTFAAFTGVMVAAAGMISALDKIKISGSGFGLIAVMASMLTATKILKELMDIAKDVTAGSAWLNLWKSIPFIIEVGALALVAAATVRLAGDSLRNAGFGLAAGFGAFYLAFVMFGKVEDQIDDSGFFKFFKKLYPYILDMLKTVGLLTGVLSLLRGLTITIGSLKSPIAKLKLGNGGGIVRGFLSFSVAMAALVGAMKLMEYLDPEKVETGAAVLSGLMVFFGFANMLAGLGRNVAANIQKMTAAIVAATVCVAFLSLFVKAGEEGRIIAPAAALMMALLGFAATIAATGRLTANVRMGNYAAIVMSAIAIAGALFVLSEYDWKSLAAAGAGLAFTLAVLGGTAEAIGDANPPSFGAWAAAIGILAAVAGSLWFLTQGEYDWKQMAASGAAMGIALIAISGSLKILGNKTEGMIQGAKALGVASLALLPAAGALWIVAQKPWDQMWIAAASMSGMILALSAALRIVGASGTQMIVGATALLIASASFIPAAAGLSQLAQYPWGQIVAATASMVVAVGTLAVIAGVLGSIAGTGAGALALAAGVAVILGLAYAFKMFVDPATAFVSAVNTLAPSVNALNESLADLSVINPEMIQNAGEKITAICTAMITAAQQQIPNVSAAMSNVGMFAAMGLQQGAMAGAPQIYGVGAKIGSSLATGTADALQVHSPSRLMLWIGQMALGGFANGASDTALLGLINNAGAEAGFQLGDGASNPGVLSYVTSAGNQLGAKLWEGLSAALGKMAQALRKLSGTLGGKDGVDFLENWANALNASSGNFAAKAKRAQRKVYNAIAPDEDQEPGGKQKSWLDQTFENALGGEGALGEWQKKLDDFTKGIGGSEGGMSNALGDLGKSGGKAGKGTKEAAEGVKELTDKEKDLYDVTTYATGAVNYLTRKYSENQDATEALMGTLTDYFVKTQEQIEITATAQDVTSSLTNTLAQEQDMLANTSPYDLAIFATQQLVLEHLKMVSAIDDDIQAIQNFGDMSVEQAQRAKEEWERVSGVYQKGFSDGDMWGSPIKKGDEWSSEDYDAANYIQNLQWSINQRKQLSDLMLELFNRGLDNTIIEEIMEKGTAEALKVAYGLKNSSDAQIKALNQLYQENLESIQKTTYDYLFKTQVPPETAEQLGLQVKQVIDDSIHSKNFEGAMWSISADLYSMLLGVSDEAELNNLLDSLGMGQYLSDYLMANGRPDAEAVGDMLYDIVTKWTTDTLDNWESQIRAKYEMLKGLQIVGTAANNAVASYGSGLASAFGAASTDFANDYREWVAAGKNGVAPQLTDYTPKAYNAAETTWQMDNRSTLEQARGAVNANDAAQNGNKNINVRIDNSTTVNQEIKSQPQDKTDLYVATRSAISIPDRKADHEGYMKVMSALMND